MPDVSMAYPRGKSHRPHPFRSQDPATDERVSSASELRLGGELFAICARYTAPMETKAEQLPLFTLAADPPAAPAIPYRAGRPAPRGRQERAGALLHSPVGGAATGTGEGRIDVGEATCAAVAQDGARWRPSGAAICRRPGSPTSRPWPSCPPRPAPDGAVGSTTPPASLPSRVLPSPLRRAVAQGRPEGSRLVGASSPELFCLDVTELAMATPPDMTPAAGYGVWFLREAKFLNQARLTLNTSCAVSGTGFFIASTG